jgi:hypothetical protein
MRHDGGLWTPELSIPTGAGRLEERLENDRRTTARWAVFVQADHLRFAARRSSGRRLPIRE